MRSEESPEDGDLIQKEKVTPGGRHRVLALTPREGCQPRKAPRDARGAGARLSPSAFRLGFGPVNPSHQDGEGINFCCFKLPSLW